jgi:tetratricopeptide (TPR) repeat protein
MLSLELGIGAPRIPLLTEGSVYFRMEKPHAPGYLQRVRRYQANSSPYRIVRQGDLAAVIFQPRSPVLPILLRRDDKGMWFVDEPAAWAAFHLYEDGSSQLKYANSAFAFARTGGNHGEGRSALYEAMATAPALIPIPFDLKALIRRAEGDIYRNPADSSAYLRLAELLHFEAYWIEAAAPLYDKVLSMDPHRSELRWRLIDIYRNSADADGQERQFKALLKANPNDRLAQWYYDWFKKFYY